METRKATINREDKNTTLNLHLNDQIFGITLTDDNPNKIKSVFNELLKELKKGLYKFNLEDENEDLYYDICIEYLKQLNSELKSIYEELKDFDLLETY